MKNEVEILARNIFHFYKFQHNFNNGKILDWDLKSNQI